MVIFVMTAFPIAVVVSIVIIIIIIIIIVTIIIIIIREKVSIPHSSESRGWHIYN